MSAVVYVLPLGPDPIASARAREVETGLEACTHGQVITLERRRVPLVDASTHNPSNPKGPTAA